MQKARLGDQQEAAIMIVWGLLVLPFLWAGHSASCTHKKGPPFRCSWLRLFVRLRD